MSATHDTTVVTETGYRACCSCGWSEEDLAADHWAAEAYAFDHRELHEREPATP